jgi:hypothetical protein
MANVLIPKKSTVAAKVPTTSDLALGEIAINHADKKLYARHPSSGIVQSIGGSDLTIGTSATDVLSIASGELTADDPGADRLLFWDDSESKLTHLTLGTALSISGTTLNAETGTQNYTTNNTYTATNYWIPAAAWIPRTTTGCGVDSREIGSTNRQNFDELLFDAATDEFAQALHILPNTYNSGTIIARFYWTASSGSGAVVWGIQGRALADDDALDIAFGTAQTVTDTLLATNDMHITSATSAITLGGTPAANRPIQFQIYRNAAAVGDTLAVDARLLGVEITFN